MKIKKDRRQCTKCHSKRNIDKLFCIYFPLIGKSYWVCNSCYHMYANDANVWTDESYSFTAELPIPIFS